MDTIEMYQEGDIVTPLDHGTDNVFYGVVVEINKKENKIYVLWSGGTQKQHEPSDIHLHPAFIDSEEVSRRFRDCYESTPSYKVASKIASKVAKEVIATNPTVKVMGDPETHGQDMPLSGGFGIMQDLVKNLRQESIQNAGKVSFDKTNLKGRRALYHRSKGRVYQRSKTEIEAGAIGCPRCSEPMEEHKFTKNEDIYICPDCGWKITTGNVL